MRPEIMKSLKYASENLEILEQNQVSAFAMNM